MTALTPIILSNNGTGIVLACTDSSGATRVALIGDGDAIVATNIGCYDAFLALGDASTPPTAVAPGSTASYPIFARTKEDQIAGRLTTIITAATLAAGVCKTGETTTLIIHRVQR